MKPKSLLISFLTLCLVAATALVTASPAAAAKPKLVDGTNISAAIYPKNEWESLLKKHYPRLFDAIDRDTLPNAYIVPGTIQTRTLAATGAQRGKAAISRSMVPQGLAIAEDYLIISAYSKGGSFHSVLYVIDKKTARYIKTIVLPGTPHVGGLAYDPAARNLWVTTESNERGACLSAIHLEHLKRYDFTQSRSAIAYDHEIVLPTLPRASFMTCDTGVLFVGYFSKRRSGTLSAYPLTEVGLPNITESSSRDLRSIAGDDYSFRTAKEFQGACFYKNLFMFSQSYGAKDSSLLVFPDDGSDPPSFEKKNALGSIAFPPYLEQLVSDGKDLYVLFESSSRPYRVKHNILPVDRVLKFDLGKLVREWE